MRIISIIALFFTLTVSAQHAVVDTLITEEGTMLIYSNRTWEYLEDRDFDGVLNERLHSEVISDTNMKFVAGWD